MSAAAVAFLACLSISCSAGEQESHVRGGSTCGQGGGRAIFTVIKDFLGMLGGLKISSSDRQKRYEIVMSDL